jgi:GntR family transcriptional regulator
MAEPMYRQIADDLRRRIESGEIERGSKLPTEFELRDQFNASRNTVRDAVRALTSQGLVITKPGQGSFVVDTIVPFEITLSRDSDTGLGGGEGIAYMEAAKAQARAPEEGQLRVEIQSATGRIGTELQLDHRDQVVSRHQTLRIDGKPWSMQTSFYPMEFVTKGAIRLVQADIIESGTVRYVAETLAFEQVGYRDLITARPPNQGEVAFFKLPEVGVAILETSRTAYDRSGRPIRYTVTVWPADRNQLVYNVGDVPPEIQTPATAS